MTAPVNKKFLEEFESPHKKQKVGCWGILRSRRVSKLSEEEVRHDCPLFRNPNIYGLKKMQMDHEVVDFSKVFKIDEEQDK